MGFKNKFTSRLTKTVALSVFFAFYLIILWFSFTSKGIYLDGHFYRKSANLTTITYTCRNPFANHRKIVMQKQVDATVITVDENWEITVSADGNWQQTAGDDNIFISETDWDIIAGQDTETTRGNAKKQPYFIVFLVYALFVLSKIFSTRVYEFLFRGKAANESYYKIFDTVFTIITAIVLVYFILPL